MNPKTFNQAMVLLLAGLMFCGCEPRDQTPLRVGIAIWPGSEPLFLARDLGYFEAARVQIVNCPGTPEIHRSFQNHAIEAAAVTLDEALQLAQTQPDVRIVLSIDFSNGADALLAKPGIKSVSDLKGKRIGVELNANGSLMLVRALETSGLTLSDITIVPISAAEAELALFSDKIDAVVAYEPTRSKLSLKGATQLFDSSQIPGEIAHVMVVRDELLRQRPAELENLLRAWFRAVEYMKEQPNDAAHRVASRHGLTPEAFTYALERLELLDHAKNVDLLDASRGGLIESMDRLAIVMERHGLLSQTANLANLLEPHLAQRAKP
jgi:NitT/TauT family transport system substrate-binding protein